MFLEHKKFPYVFAFNGYKILQKPIFRLNSRYNIATGKWETLKWEITYVKRRNGITNTDEEHWPYHKKSAVSHSCRATAILLWSNLV